MKISYNWLQDHVDLSAYEASHIADMLTAIGLEVEGIEEVQPIKGGLRGLVIGKVLTCEKHPNADKLSLTTVDIGQDSPLQIVCGAPNVATGQQVVVATVGTELHSIAGESFTIKKGKIRGAVSEGMICAEDEIGLGEDHKGIIVLEEQITPGTPAADYYDVQSDYVFEIGLTPNRADATSHRGVANDLCAYLRVNEGYLPNLQESPSIDFPSTGTSIAIQLKDPIACPRYAGLSMKVRMGPSPDWLQTRLSSIGIKPKNNVVDATNFILHDLGQPLHAFDARSLEGGIVVQTLPAGTTFTTLDQIERTLNEQDLMICNMQGEPLAMAGVMGGAGSAVSEDTKEIFIESAHFDAAWIRRSSMRHNLRTDAAKIYEKGSDPNLPVHALHRIAKLLSEIADAEALGPPEDVYPLPIDNQEITLHFARVQQLIGCHIPEDRIVEIVQALHMQIVRRKDDSFTVSIPTDKPDVLREVDLIEEILRIYGLDNVPIPDTMRIHLKPKGKGSTYDQQNRAAHLLVSHGFNECMSLSLTDCQWYEHSDVNTDTQTLVHINNTSNVQLSVMRPQLLVSALDNVRYNQNRKQQDLRLFEFGSAYGRTENGFSEEAFLTLTLTGSRHTESWHHPEAKVSFFTLKAYVNLIFAQFGVSGWQEHDVEDNPDFAYALKYHRGSSNLAVFGRIHPSVLERADVQQEVFYAAIHWDVLLDAAAHNTVRVAEPDKYPSMRRDLALVVNKQVRFEKVVAIARKTEKKLLRDINLFDVYENEEHLGAGMKSYAVSYVFVHPEKTLNDKAVDKIMQKLIRQYEQQLGATIRR